MPHSSGGGSGGGGGGGGFHGGSSSHSHSGTSSYTPTYRYSRTPFVGAMCYVYYAHGEPQLIYSNDKPTKSFKAYWISLIVKLIILILPLFIIIFTSFHFPKKLNTNYNTEIIIADNIDVLSDEEETKLKQTFASFFDKTGITPAVVTTDDYTYTLEDYAYNYYVKSFNDEKHWLIAYYYNNERDIWQFEGMQGNDTDTILYSDITTEFNKTIYNELNSKEKVGTAIDNAFNVITPKLMKNYYKVETPAIIFTAIWAAIFISLIVGDSIALFNKYRLKDATPVKDQTKLVLKKCPYCDTPYYAGTIKRCHSCNAVLEDDDPFTSSNDNEELK